MRLVVLQTKAHCPPFPFVLQIGRAFTGGLKKKIGPAFWKETFGFYDNGSVSWAADEKEDKRCIRESTEAVLRDPRLITTVRDTFLKKIKGFNRLVAKIKKMNLKKLSSRELYGLWMKFNTGYREAYIWSEPFAFFTKDSLAEILLKYLITKTEPGKAYEYLNILVSPLEKSFIKREETDMFRIAVKVKKNPELKKNLLEKHTKKWFWVPYDYGIMVWKKRHFEKELDDIIRNKNPAKELKKINRHFSNLRKEQKILIKKLDIDKKHQQLFEDVRICAFIMDFKKEEFTKSHIAARPMLKETAKRLGLSFTGVQYITEDELRDGLVKGIKLDNKRMEKREKQSYLYYTSKSIHLYDGEKARKLIKKLKKNIKKSGKKVEGMPACPGKYTGKVRIMLNPRKINELRKGEILVTNMTSPDFVVGMKRAGAIVTNEGGITSHAAIVSRELGIPCIIGTRNASKVFKTGDMVEVDADKGVVRILKKTKD